MILIPTTWSIWWHTLQNEWVQGRTMVMAESDRIMVHYKAEVQSYWQILAICEMITAWKDNLFEAFIPGLVSSLDESVSTWINKYTCPGFFFCLKKPWSFGNKYHTIANVLSGFWYDLEIVKGKDQPQEMHPDFDEMRVTVGLLICFTKSFGTLARLLCLKVVLGLQGIVELKNWGVFSLALIKKCCY